MLKKSKSILAWKLFRLDSNNNLCTLYHGWNGTKKIPRKTWLKAENKIGKDNGPTYITGWHCFITRKEAEKYSKRFIHPVIIWPIRA